MDKATPDPERHAVKTWAEYVGWRHAVCGGTWGDNNEHKLGSRLLNLRDTRKGHEGEPHPILSRISPLLAANIRGNMYNGVHRQFEVKSLVYDRKCTYLFVYICARSLLLCPLSCIYTLMLYRVAPK